MLLETSRRMAGVHMPPIHPIMNRVRDMRSRGETVYSMAQAVPWYGPPEEALLRFRERMDEPGFNFYSPDPGHLSVRSSLSEDFHSRRGVNTDPECELHLTCGASQAFLSALLAVADPGDRVVVLEPYYFDHIFAIQFSGLQLDCIPMTEENGWEIPWEALRSRLPGASVLVLVNPGNPTGFAASEKELRELEALTERNRCALIIDETYERFNFTGSGYHPWQERKAGHVLTVGSFSKSFSLSGWRLGYLFGPGEILKEALKVQDSVVICPPTPSQLLLEECLKLDGWVEDRSREVFARLSMCRDALDSSRGLQWRECGGGFFTLAAAKEGLDCYRLADHLLDEYGIASIPGDAFGVTGRGHLRLSFGCLSDQELKPAMEALSSVDLTGVSL